MKNHGTDFIEFTSPLSENDISKIIKPIKRLLLNRL